MATMSKVIIANMALSHVGAKSTIESFDEGSVEANMCKLWYDYSLEQTLEGFDWSFARKRVDASLDGDDPPDQWTYRYQYPADCAKLRRIWNPCGEHADAVPFELETNSDDSRTVLTDMQDAVFVYTKVITNPRLYSKFFIETLSRVLASKIGFTLTGKREIVKDQTDAYQNLMRIAPSLDANESMQAPAKQADWIAGRNRFVPYRNERG